MTIQTLIDIMHKILSPIIRRRVPVRVRSMSHDQMILQIQQRAAQRDRL